MGTKMTYPGFHVIKHHDAVFKEKVHDAYKIKEKLHEPTACPTCNAVFHNGRWQWISVPADAQQHSCPACQRIHDHYPAGFLTLEGDFFSTHSDEIIRLARHVEEKEKSEHPLQRIMAVEEQDNTTLITTTDIHLARGIADAIHQAYQGNLEFHYNPEENLLRAHWSH